MNAFFKNEKKLISLGLERGGAFLYEETDSTNTRAKEYLSKMSEPTSPILFAAKKQSMGRGTKGRSFLSSEETGLWFSLLYTPKRKDFDPCGLTAMAAVALLESVRALVGDELSDGFYIKWVNDLFFGKKKIAGILAERGIAAGGFFGYVIGIGINLYSSPLPEAISDIAASVEDVTSKKLKRDELLYEITRRLIEYLEDPSGEKILNSYRKMSLPPKTPISVTRGDLTRSASIVSIDSSFRLVVEYENGEREALISADVTVRH